ncbi:hypothetical protein [Alicyclobacillus macrosporangiidus]|uniref:Uncharacterized protein n=1 Tax=Alicyclobacillus macrosporangiidus TaxID=392015 RepID=A0A1I7KDC8_9BACL|nr:hypothetical protein [Alicyclobacillus macrosporangiidus]SFU95438.1 hypothetical protein SAMN05421543_11550 [Alicyclobacillus macrosporangiidus]
MVNEQLNEVQDAIEQLRDWIRERRAFDPEQTKRLLNMSAKLMESETKSSGDASKAGFPDVLVDNLAFRLRGLRDALNRIIATSIVRGIEENAKTPLDFGITVDWLENGFTIHMPYSMVSMSDWFLVRSKRISGLQSLNTVRDAWGSLIRSLERERPAHMKSPFWRVAVRVDIFVEHPEPLDPDHFWIRPILDALVNRRFLVDDDAEHIIFMLHYHMRQEAPRVSITVRAMDGVERDETLP